MGYAHLAREERYYICQAVKSGVFDVSCGIHASKSWVMGAPIR